MRAILSTIVAAIITLHSVLGCCWHHAHDDSEPCAAVPVTESQIPANHGGCRHHKHDAPAKSDRQADDSDHHDHRRPCEEKCNVVAEARAELDDTSCIAGVQSSQAISQSVVPTKISLSTVIRVVDTAASPPVRRHLLLLQLLI